jgi:hypothetical protein
MWRRFGEVLRKFLKLLSATVQVNSPLSLKRFLTDSKTQVKIEVTNAVRREEAHNFYKKTDYAALQLLV